jgi:hypothetical protein
MAYWNVARNIGVNVYTRQSPLKLISPLLTLPAEPT